MNIPLAGKWCQRFSKDILFNFNTQHDCQAGKCSATGRRMQQQEREASAVTIHYIEHGKNKTYIVNTHALHNSHLLREALPRHLTKPIPYCTDRRALHDRLAATLRGTQATKRAQTKEKTAATNAAKAAAALAGGKGTETERQDGVFLPKTRKRRQKEPDHETVERDPDDGGQPAAKRRRRGTKNRRTAAMDDSEHDLEEAESSSARPVTQRKSGRMRTLSSKVRLTMEDSGDGQLD